MWLLKAGNNVPGRELYSAHKMGTGKGLLNSVNLEKKNEVVTEQLLLYINSPISKIALALDYMTARFSAAQKVKKNCVHSYIAPFQII